MTYDDLLAPVEETDLFDPDKFFLRHLSLGFSFLQKCAVDESYNTREMDMVLEGGGRGGGGTGGGGTLFSRPVVNFVDPTMSSSMTLTSSSGHGGGGAQQQQQQQPLQLCKTIIHTFERDHHNTLQQVPYQNYRSGADGVIDQLRVQLTHSPHGAGILESSASSLDASEWHMAPICHVYIAACQSLEHYRTKVKPSIQIFLSQLEAAAAADPATATPAAAGPAAGSSPTRTAASSSNSSSSSSSAYLIVFVPTGERPATSATATGDDASAAGGRSRVAAFASRVVEARAKARQRMSRAGEGTSETGSGTATANNSDDEGGGSVADTSVTTTAPPPAAPVPTTASLVQQLTKVEREIVRRLTADFGSGRVCTFSSLLEQQQQQQSDQNGDSVEDEHQLMIQRLEWELFTKELGATIVDGFQARCRRYDDELKRLGALHAAHLAASEGQTKLQQASALGGAKTRPATSPTAFNLTHFLLVKESFAFTYEQMCLHAEALLQYEELQALLPDFQAQYFLQNGSDNTNMPMSPPAMGGGGGKRSLLQVALAGDALTFRRRLQAVEDDDLDPFVQEIEHYILVRQTALLFRLKSSVGVVARCKSFVQKLYEYKRAQLVQSSATSAASSSSNNGEAGTTTTTQSLPTATTNMLSLNKWAFEFCWDVTMASRRYSSVALAKQDKQSELFARSVCDVLDFARYRFSDLGKLQFPDYKAPKFLGGDALPPELNAKIWEPWVEPETAVEADSGGFEMPENGVIATALSTRESFERIHAKLTKVLASFMESCGRKRYAACLRLAVIDVDVRGNQLRAAEKELRSIAKTYAGDNWNACSFFLLFQLVKLQRKSENAVTYLDTLVQCFSGTASPRRALMALFDDLFAVVQCPSTVGSNMELAPIFKIALGLEDFSMLNVVGSDRNLLKKVYSVGDTVPVTVCLTSQLPKDVVAKKITVSLVPFQTYVSKVEDSIEITPDDIFHAISLSDVTVRPGRNDLTLKWIPGTTGQFILSAMSLEWENCTFSYPAKGMNRPTVRVDVLPCDPTQSLRIEPNFLVPGHEQPVQIVFATGNDIVDSGTVQLVGSSGVLLSEVDKESGGPSAWQSIMTLDLPACPARQTEVLHVFVKSEVDKETGSAAALHVQATTLFRPDVGDESEEKKTEKDDETSHNDGRMECALSASVTTLGKAAFVVDDAEAVSYGADGLVISASLRCNAPSPFVLQKWSLDLPSCLELVDSVDDLNASLVHSTISPGERVSMAFHARARSQLPPASLEGTLHITYDNGAGTTFSDSLSVELLQPVRLPMQKAGTQQEVQIELCPFPPAGLVGSPIDITCTVDLPSTVLSSIGGKDVLYAVHLESDAWVMHGKTEGVLLNNNSTDDGSGGRTHKLKFVAIPTCPGLIEEYMSICLTVQGDNADDEGQQQHLLELPVKVNHTAPFNSFDPASHTTVAFLDT